MEVLIVFDNLQGELKELTYYSEFNRINAKGIKEEAKQKLLNTYGYNAKNYEIKKLYRN